MPESKLVRLGSIFLVLQFYLISEKRKKKYSNSFFLLLLFIFFISSSFQSKLELHFAKILNRVLEKQVFQLPLCVPYFTPGFCTHTARCNNEEAGGIRLKRSNHCCILQALLERQGESDIGWP